MKHTATWKLLPHHHRHKVDAMTPDRGTPKSRQGHSTQRRTLREGTVPAMRDIRDWCQIKRPEQSDSPVACHTETPRRTQECAPAPTHTQKSLKDANFEGKDCSKMDATNEQKGRERGQKTAESERHLGGKNIATHSMSQQDYHPPSPPQGPNTEHSED